MFDIHLFPFDEDDEWDDEAVENYCSELTEEFATSPEGEAHADPAAEGLGDCFFGCEFSRQRRHGLPGLFQLPTGVHPGKKSLKDARLDRI